MATSTLYFLKYNNYYNRLAKREESLQAYQEYLLGEAVTGIAFNPGDGVYAREIINWNYDTPDYCIVEDDNTGNLTRWFITECNRTRAGQYSFNFYRDVIADYMPSVKESVCFVEKGYLPNNSPLIYNKENMGFNQVKTDEILLENNLKTPWIVCYLSRYDGEGNYNSFSGSFNNYKDLDTVNYTFPTLSDYPLYGYTEEPYIYLLEDNTVEFMVRYYDTTRPGGATNLWLGKNGQRSQWFSGVSTTGLPTYAGVPQIPNASTAFSAMLNAYKANSVAGSDGVEVNSISGFGTADGADYLREETGKTIFAEDEQNSVYSVGIQYQNYSQQVSYKQVTTGTTLYQLINTYMIANSGMTTGTSPYIAVSFPYSGWGRLTMTLTEGSLEKMTYNFNYSEGAVTIDSVYEIIATPFRSGDYTVGTSTIHHDGAIAMQWFQDIINRYNGSGFAYDIQLIPYCPVDETNLTNYKTIITQNSAGTIVTRAVGVCLPTSTFSRTYNIDMSEYLSDDPKLDNETKLFRFVSPNGVGEYEFSPSKNGGFSQWEVDCTLLPFNPYIKVSPVFGGLYGTDFNDYRGLILSGDYSLPILNNEWENYQLNNKYYQQIFNRNIESQEYNNNWTLASNIVGSIAGAGTGAASGAMIGSMAGPAGTAVGAVAGGALSLAGGIMDTVATQKTFRESIDRQKDLFGMELGTIKARAQTLTRGTSYNINNKYFPYVEYFTATEEEITAYKNKIKYNGMTVGVIGKLVDYLNNQETTYFQGTLIEIDITDDSHMADEIAKNLQGGLRFYAD